MASNFGIGVGAFMEGMNSGITAGQRIREIRDNNKARDITAKAGETARAKRQADIGMGIKRGAVDSAQGPVPTYEVGGRQFNDEQSALAESEKKVGSLQDYYFKEVMPQLQQHYMDIGQPDKSFAIGKSIEDEQFQKGAKSWAKATAAFMSGDEKGFLKNYVEAYNNRGYDDDGMTAKGMEPIKDKSGNTLGYKVTLADRDGKETVQEFTGADIGRQSLMYMAPAEVLERNLSMFDAAQSAQAEIAKEERKFSRDVKLEGMKQGYGIQRDNNKSLLNTAEKAAELRMGTNNTAKTTSDTDLRKQIYLQLRKEGQKVAENNKLMRRTDPVFNDLPLAEQERVVEEQLKMLKGGNQQKPVVQSGAPAPVMRY